MRKTLEKSWFSLLLFSFICIGIFRVLQSPSRRVAGGYREGHERQLKELRSDILTSTEAQKHGTKSLSSKRDFGRYDSVLFFNRVPKSGSEMLVLLLQWLQGVNGFRHVRLPGGENRRLAISEEISFVEEVTKIIRRTSTPVSFDRHLYFVNFTRHEKPSPIFLNLVRDPIDKAVSRFYYGRVTPNPNNPDIKFAKRRATKPQSVTTGTFEQCVMSQDPECSFITGKLYDLTIPYFCGQDKQCMVLNDAWALRRAKKNVEKYFPVVGVLEELNSTLAVLENNMPVFFKGVQDMYYHELLEPHKNANRMRPRKTDMAIRSYLKTQLKTEYDFYYWLRSRLVDQWRLLNKVS